MPTLKYIFISLTVALTACGAVSTDKSEATAATVSKTEVRFDADSAYAYVKAQTDFGPRVPGTEAHRRCADYLIGRMQSAGADTVITQRATVTAFDGTVLPIINIMGRFAPERKDRVLLVSHWDSRPWADQETDPASSRLPIDGANDGASGVGVLLEIARQAALHGTKTGVDILLVDAEDYGSPGDEGGSETTWCLGTQHWVTDMPYAGTDRPRYGVLLDMVGGRNAVFHREQISDAYAPRIVDQVWGVAASLGLSGRFINSSGGAVVDDHLFINQAGIPCIDIIESFNPATYSFNPTWHTHDDNIDNIDRSTLKAVGDVVTALVIK